MSAALRGVTLTVVAGTTTVPTRTFARGARADVVSVGSRGEWEISAPGVEPTHLYFTFDGSQLSVAAASPGARVLLRGVPVGRLWREVVVPSEVHFGSACIIVLPAEVPESADPENEVEGSEPGSVEVDEDECVTQFRCSPLDASRGIDAPTMMFDAPTVIRESKVDVAATDMAREDASRDADPPTLIFNIPNAVRVSRAAALAPGMAKEKAPPLVPTMLEKRVLEASRTPLFPELDAPTCCDGGALREQAAQLARAMPSAVTVPPPLIAKSAVPGAVTARSAKAAADQAAATPSVSSAPCRAAVASPNAEAAPRRQSFPEFMDRVVVSWRDASRLQRAIFVLLSIALCAALWSQNSDAHSNGAASVASRPKPHAAKHNAISAVSSANGYSMDRLPAVATPPSAAAVSVASASVATPSESPETPAIQRVAEGFVSPKSNTLPPRFGPAASTAQRDAFNAARVGKLAEAAEMYQRLAAGSNSSVFGRAARLAHDKAVRTP